MQRFVQILMQLAATVGVVAGLLVAGLLVGGVAQAQPPKLRPPQVALSASYLARDWFMPGEQLGNRELTTRLERAFQVLRDEETNAVEYSRALDDLQRQLLDTAGDCFVTDLPTRRNPNARFDVALLLLPPVTPLKEVVERIIAELPPKGREIYERNYGSEAAALLKQAFENGDPNALRRVTQLYFHTRAGHEAAYRLASTLIEAPRPVETLRLLTRLASSPEARQRFEPGLSVKLAIVWTQLGRAESALRVLAALPAERLAQLPLAMRGTSPQQSLERLQTLLTGPVGDVAPLAAWTHFMGDAARRASAAPISSADEPLWQSHSFGLRAVPTAEQLQSYRFHLTDEDAVTDPAAAAIPAPIGKALEMEEDPDYSPPTPKTEAQLAAAMQIGHEWIVRRNLESKRVPLPATHPLAVQGAVVFRTLSRVRCVEAKTGQLRWETAMPDSAFADLFAVGDRWELLDTKFPKKELFSPLPVLQHAFIDLRSRHDRAVGTLSTDGRRVFYLEACGITEPNATGLWGTKSTVPGSWNRLCAVDLTTGRLDWEIGVPATDGSPASGDFILGPPAVVEGRLYCLAENKADVRLLCLDPTNGGTLWEESLLRPHGSIQEESLRRIAADSPTFVDGWLLCPTTSGFVLAYDLAARRLGWAYDYETSTHRPERHFQQGFGRLATAPRMVFDQIRSDDHWTESSLFAADGRVFVAPLDSDELHAIDSVSGAVIWKQPRHNGAYLAGVFEQRLIVIEHDSVKALEAGTGQLIWSMPLGNQQASGRGLMTGSLYHLPVLNVKQSVAPSGTAAGSWSSHVLTINLLSGRLVSKSPNSPVSPFGNLVAVDGSLISQTFDRVTAFPSPIAVEAQLAQRLAKQPSDAEALARRGRLRCLQGRESEGLADLAASLKAEPNADVKQGLVDLSFERLRVGQTTATELRQFFEQLDVAKDVARKLGRIEADVMAEQGEPVAAFRKLLDLADQSLSVDDPATEHLGDVTLHRGHILVAQMASVYRRAAESKSPATEVDKPNARQQLDGLVRQRFDAALKTKGPRDLRRFLKMFEWHPTALEARWELVTSDRLEAKLDFLERERHASVLAGQSNPELSAPGQLALLHLWLEAEKPAANEATFEQFERRLKKVRFEDGTLAADRLSELRRAATTARPGAPVAAHVWPEVMAAKDREVLVRAPHRESVALLGNVSPAIRAWTIAIETTLDPNPNGEPRRVVARNGLGQELWRFPIDSDLARPFDGGLMNCLSHGHLVAVSDGGRLLMIDVSDAKTPKPLWTRDVIDFQRAFGGADDERRFTAPSLDQKSKSRWQSPAFVRRQNEEFFGSVDLLTSEYVVYRTDSQLHVANSMTGQVIWTRSNIRRDARIVGDDAMLVIHDPTGRSQVLRLFDGELLASPAALDFEDHLTSAGRDMIVWQQESQTNRLARIDALTGQAIWSRKFSNDAVVQVVDHETIVVLDTSGTLQFFDAWTGAAFIDTQVPADPRLRYMHVLPRASGYVVLTTRGLNHRGTELNQRLQPSREHQTIWGPLHGLSSRGKLLWSADRVAETQTILLDQPRDIPVLAILNDRPDRDANVGRGRAGNTSFLQLLDDRTGKVLFEGRLPTAPQNLQACNAIDARPDERQIDWHFDRSVISLTFGKPTQP